MMIIVDDDVVTTEELNYFKNEIVRSSSLPVYHTVTYGELSKYDMFTHTLLVRGSNENGLPTDQRINSQHYFPFYKIFKRFCDKHEITINEIYRSCINATFAIDGLEKFDAHIDHDFDHKIFLLYLNDLPYSEDNNSTVVYNQKLQDIGVGLIENENKELSSKLTVLDQVHPKAGRCLFFAGNFHSIKIPTPNFLRYVCVFTFT